MENNSRIKFHYYAHWINTFSILRTDVSHIYIQDIVCTDGAWVVKDSISISADLENGMDGRID